jgi:hypothetical protein
MTLYGHTLLIAGTSIFEGTFRRERRQASADIASGVECTSRIERITVACAGHVY